ncbi:GRAM domain-containing protein 1B-like isoform X5 [Tachysurus ichikawai]
MVQSRALGGLLCVSPVRLRCHPRVFTLRRRLQIRREIPTAEELYVNSALRRTRCVSETQQENMTLALLRSRSSEEALNKSCKSSATLYSILGTCHSFSFKSWFKKITDK